MIRYESWRVNQSVTLYGKPARLDRFKTGASGTVWIRVQYDNGDYDWAYADADDLRAVDVAN